MPFVTRCNRRDLLLALVACLWAIPVGIAVAQGEANLALGKPFACNCELLPGWTGLVDGITDSDEAPGCFATDNSPDFPKEVTIDLGMLYPVTRIAVHNSANGNTHEIALSVSADGRQYTTLREFRFPQGQYMQLVHSFAQRMVRYVRVTMRDTWKGGLGGDNCLYLREIEVFGDKGGAQPSPANSLAMAQARNPVFSPYWVRAFKRYCLDGPDNIRVAVLGDSFGASSGTGGTDWPAAFVADLSRHYGENRVKLEDLAKEGQLPSAMLDQAKEWGGGGAPDIIVLAYGRDAAMSDMPVAKFRGELTGLVDALIGKVDAPVVLVTPPPLLQSDKLPGYDKVKGKSSNAYAYEVENIAVTRNLPLVRSAGVLGRDPQALVKMYKSDSELGDDGHQEIAMALFTVFK
jgi:hypothetical protein